MQTKPHVTICMYNHDQPIVYALHSSLGIYSFYSKCMVDRLAALVADRSDTPAVLHALSCLAHVSLSLLTVINISTRRFSFD